MNTIQKTPRKNTTTVKTIPAKHELVEIDHDTKYALERAAEDQGITPTVFLAAAVKYIIGQIEIGRFTMDSKAGLPGVATVKDFFEIHTERTTVLEDILAMINEGAPDGDGDNIENAILDMMRRGQSATKLYAMLEMSGDD